MNKLEKIIFSLILFLLITISGGIYAEEKIKVYVYQRGNDSIGPRLAYEIKEKLSSSMRYELINEPKEATLTMLVETEILKFGDKVEGSVISAIFIYKPVELNSYFGMTLAIIPNVKEVKSRAEKIIAFMDTYYQNNHSRLKKIFDYYIEGITLRTLKELEKKKKD